MITMSWNETATLASFFDASRSVFFCPLSPQFIWDLNHTTSLKIVVAVSVIACPVTVLLNLLVIIAEKTRKELKQNSNILISSLALADLVVGAVSMPLAITIDSLILHRVLLEDVVCSIDYISAFLRYATGWASFLHLVLIAWERHLAVTKWMHYKALLTRRRLNTYITMAWIVSILLMALAGALHSTGVNQTVIYIVDGIGSLFAIFCLLSIVYFYVLLYSAIRKQNRTQVRQLNVVSKAQLENKIAYTAFLLTLLVSISVIPNIVVYLFAGIYASLRESSVFRWTETILQLNSLFYPLLYFYRNRRLREAAFLELLSCRQSRTIQPTVRHIRRRRYSMASINMAEEFQHKEQRPRLTRSESCDAVMCSDRGRSLTRSESCDVVMCSDNGRSNSHQACAVKETSMSTSPCVAISEVFTQQQQNEIVVTVQIENVPRRKPTHGITKLTKTSKGLKRSPHGIGDKTARSSSLNCHQNTADEKLRRSNSMPTLPRNFVVSDNKLSFSDFRNEKGTVSKRYEETKL